MEFDYVYILKGGDGYRENKGEYFTSLRSSNAIFQQTPLDAFLCLLSPVFLAALYYLSQHAPGMDSDVCIQGDMRMARKRDRNLDLALVRCPGLQFSWETHIVEQVRDSMIGGADFLL